MRRPDPRLVLLAQQGDRQALDLLLRAAQASLHRYIASLVGGPDRSGGLAEDVLQETFLRIVRKLRWLDEPLYFRAWAFRIASREAFRALGRRGGGEALDAVPPGALAVDPPELDRPDLERERDTLRAAVAELPPASRAVLSLHYFEELSLDEVADTLSVPLGTVKSRLAYGLGLLRRREEMTP